MDNPNAGGWSSFRRLARGVLIVLGTWAAVAYLVVPLAVHIAYRIDLPIVGDLMAGRATTPVANYLESWQAYADRVSGIVIWVGAYLVSLGALSAFATGEQHRGRDDQARPWLRPTFIVSLLCLVAAAAIFFIHWEAPVAYVHAVVEDGWGEQAQFLGWITIPFLLAWRAPAGRTPGVIAFAIVGFVFAMEEISWGQRLLGLGTPEAISAINYQNELSIHNINMFYDASILSLTPWHLVGIGILAWTFLLPVAFRRFPRLARAGTRLGTPLVPGYLAPLAMLAFFFLVYEGLARWKEIGELAAALFCVAVALAVIMEAERGTRIRGGRESTGLAALFLIITGFAIPISDPGGLPWAFNVMAARHYPAMGMHEQAVVLFEHIEEHPEYALDRTRLDYADVLQALGRHEEVREVLERDLAARTEHMAEEVAEADDHRTLGEVLSRLSRQAEAEQAFRRALQLDQARLDRTTTVNDRAIIHWSLARTSRLIADSSAVSAHMREALATTRARDRQDMLNWLQQSELEHLVPLVD